MASTGVSLLLLGVRMLASGSNIFWFLAWNLFLAWLPLIFALGLRLHLSKNHSIEWKSVMLFVLWLGFLPNSFYIMSDLIHLQSSGDVAILYDIAMMMSFIINGLILGYLSVYIVHVQVAKRLKRNQTWLIILLVFLSCGFAIYLGRYLRWNTWDILLNPAGILFDLSERIVNPVLHAEAYYITFVFFVLLTSTYAIIYQLVKLLSANTRPR